MGGHAAADGQNTLRIVHAFDILGGGLQSHEHDLLALLAFFDGVLGREHDATAGGAGRCGKRGSDGFRRFQSLRVELRVKERVERLGIDLHERFLFGNHALVDEVAGDFDSGLRRALAVTGLEHVEFSVLDGELHILHIAVMVFEGLADFLELRVAFGHDLRHLGDGHGGTDARNDVFALRVHQKFAHELLFARGGVARERHARSRRIAHVAERHHLYVYRRAPAVRNVVLHSVIVRAGVVPRTEHRFDRAEELLFRIIGEVYADFRLIFRFELGGELFEVVRGELDVLRDALFFLHLVDELFEIFLADLHDDVGIHLDKSSVAVPRPTGIARFLGDDFDNRLVETEVQNGVHHAGHGSSRAGADGNEKRVFEIAEFLARNLFHLLDVGEDFRLNVGIDLSAVLVILRAGLRGNGEALRNRKAETGHFRKMGALTAEKLAHFRITLCKEVAILFCHS